MISGESVSALDLRERFVATKTTRTICLVRGTVVQDERDRVEVLCTE